MSTLKGFVYLKVSQYSSNVRSHLLKKFHGDLDSGVLANVSHFFFFFLLGTHKNTIVTNIYVGTL